MVSRVGESKAKKQRRELFLQANPRCTYCGAPATTIDHCPPRCFFEDRNWPKGYEFAACLQCNRQSSKDEQLLAVLTRVRHDSGFDQKSHADWERLLRGVRNNQLEILTEWTAISPTRTKRFLRDVFGIHGDGLRRAGWGAINLGPLTKAAASRFLVKVEKALYYKHIGVLLDGVLFIKKMPAVSILSYRMLLSDILRPTSRQSKCVRNKIDLSDQFAYWFEPREDVGVLYAFLRFGEQFTALIIAVRHDAEKLFVSGDGPRLPSRGPGRYDCRLMPIARSNNV